jgi:hypothetical protein
VLCLHKKRLGEIGPVRPDRNRVLPGHEVLRRATAANLVVLNDAGPVSRLNPGDLRSAYFANMLSAALSSTEIRPSDAASLTDWAYRDSSAPWDNGTDWLNSDNYKLPVWRDAYRSAREGPLVAGTPPPAPPRSDRHP